MSCYLLRFCGFAHGVHDDPEKRFVTFWPFGFHPRWKTTQCDLMNWIHKTTRGTSFKSHSSSAVSARNVWFGVFQWIFGATIMFVGKKQACNDVNYSISLLMLARWQHADNLSLKPEKRFELPPWWTNIWRCWKDVGSVRSMQEPAWDCVRGWRKILGCLKHEDIQVEISLSHWCVKRHSADSTWFRWYLQLVETLLDWNVPKAFESTQEHPKSKGQMMSS